ncbi:MAG: ParA family protein [Alphaproteobacteria bacterium]|jgi:chromosome partitioning protein|nr:ParA family protein [Alphaproteobacteria bacterium]
MPARLVSVINMKGGVGKSTTTVGLAETLGLHHRQRTLVIDLDPQTNASIMIGGPERWDALREDERTLDFYFEAFALQQQPVPFRSLISKKVTDLVGAPDIDLVAAAPEFRIVERDMIESFVKRGFHIDAIQKWICERFAQGLRMVMSDYDTIFIDCPPGISLFAEAALIAADAILVPTIPDYVSRLGLISFRKRALRLINERRGGDSRLFVLATKYDEAMSLHRSEADLLAENLGEAMFVTRVPQHVDIARAAEWSDTPRTFERKYGAMAPIVKRLGDEFIDKLALAPA